MTKTWLKYHSPFMIIIILIINIIIAILVFPTSVLPSLLLHLLLFGTIDFPPNYSFLVSSSPTIVIVIIISIIIIATTMHQYDSVWSIYSPYYYYRTGFFLLQCKHCGKAFASHAAHDSHVRRTHSKERPCACNVCGKAFSQPFELKFHMSSHIKQWHHRSDSTPFPLWRKRLCQQGSAVFHLADHTTSMGCIPRPTMANKLREFSDTPLQMVASWPKTFCRLWICECS